jgi:hypothetical protein
MRRKILWWEDADHGEGRVSELSEDLSIAGSSGLSLLLRINGKRTNMGSKLQSRIKLGLSGPKKRQSVRGKL